MIEAELQTARVAKRCPNTLTQTQLLGKAGESYWCKDLRKSLSSLQLTMELSGHRPQWRHRTGNTGVRRLVQKSHEINK